jgi:hypothetical protein
MPWALGSAGLTEAMPPTCRSLAVAGLGGKVQLCNRSVSNDHPQTKWVRYSQLRVVRYKYDMKRVLYLGKVLYLFAYRNHIAFRKDADRDEAREGRSCRPDRPL